jgi:hypothetical protein
VIDIVTEGDERHARVGGGEICNRRRRAEVVEQLEIARI